jgi:hypothetical protein
MENPTNANDLVPTPASAWKGKVVVAGVDLLLPSGNVARVKSMSPTAFLTQGVIPDPLSDIITKAIKSKRGMRPEQVKKMAEDPKQIDAALELFDRVLSSVMVMPAVKMPPKCTECGEYANIDARHTDDERDDYHAYQEGPRNPNVLYADEVDITDKIFIFQYSLTGVSDLESFRAELPRSMGGLSDEQDLQLQAK